MRGYIYIHKKAQTSLLLIYAQGPSHCPQSQINNNETYADMTTRQSMKRLSEYECHTRRHLLLTLFLTLDF